MKKVLLIADTYYPDSRATIQIAQRIAEELVKRGYTVEALPLHMENRKQLVYPASHNGVSILKLSDYDLSEEEQFILQKKMNQLCYRVALAPKKFLIKDPGHYGEKWNEMLLRFVRKVRKEVYEKPQKNIFLCEYTERMRKCIRSTVPDLVISVALPFDIHYCMSKAIAGTPIKWIATGFDPYAFEQLLDKTESKRRLAQEYRVYKNAAAVLLLSQFQNDYAREKLREKIRFVELPNIRPLQPSVKPEKRFFDENDINCAFIGNLYGVKRNPSFIFDFFEKMTDENIHLYVIGSLIDISPEDIEQYSRKMNGRLHYLGRVGQQEAIDAMFEADVLVNVGHTTSNQCPSKVLDYMSTGKPILHIAKRDTCSSLPYLVNYEDWICVEEKAGLRDDVIRDVQAFILNSKGKKRIPFEHVREALPNCTIEKYVDTIERSL